MSTTDEVDTDAGAHLRQIAEVSSISPPWIDAVRQLGPQSTPEERLAVYRAVRDSGWLSLDEGLFLVTAQIEEMTDAEAAAKLHDIDDRIQALEELLDSAEREVLPNDAAVAEHDKLSLQYQESWDEVFVSKLTTLGEREIADLYREDPDEFARSYAAGLEQFRAVMTRDNGDAPNELVRVASYGNLPGAELAHSALQRAGIASALGNANVVLWDWLYSNAVGGVTLDQTKVGIDRESWAGSEGEILFHYGGWRQQEMATAQG